MWVSKVTSRAMCDLCATTSLRATVSNTVSPSRTMAAWSRMRSSSSNRPAMTSSRRSVISAGMMSARKPSRPRLIPSSGTPCSTSERAACKNVPSPATTMTRSQRAPSCARASYRQLEAGHRPVRSRRRTAPRTRPSARYATRRSSVATTRSSPCFAMRPMVVNIMVALVAARLRVRSRGHGSGHNFACRSGRESIGCLSLSTDEC